MMISDPKVIALLSQGSKNLIEQFALAKQRGLIDAQQQQAAIKLSQVQRELSAQMKQIGDSIASAAIPAITGLLTAITALVSYVQEHKAFFVTAFGVAAVGAVWALRGQILGLIPVITRMAGATLAALGPWLLIGGAIAAVALVAEDIYTYFTDPTALTVTGALAEKFSSVRDFPEASKAEVMALWGAIQQFGADAVAIWDSIIKSINSLNDNAAFTAFVDGARTKFTELRDWLQSWSKAVGDFLYSIFANVVNGAVDTLNQLPGVNISRMQSGAERQGVEQPPTQSPGGVDMAVPGDQVPGVPLVPSVASAGNALKEASNSPINSISNNATSMHHRSNTTHAPVNIERMEINTQSSDPEAVRGAVVGGIQDEWKNAVAQTDDGISH